MANGALRYARGNKGWTLQELAEKVGLGVKTLQRLEEGVILPRMDLRDKLCEVFDMTAEELGLVPNSVQAIQSTVDQVAGANPKNIQEVAASQLAIINSYYLNGLEQSQQSFRWSLIWGGIGFLFFVGAVTVLLFRQPNEVALASGIGGVIVEVFAGTYLYLYKHASDQLASFRLALDNSQRILLANSMCVNLEKPEKQTMQIELIRLIVTSATQQVELGSLPSKIPNNASHN